MSHGYRQFHYTHQNRWYLKYIAEYVASRFDTWNYELGRPLPKEKNKKIVGLIKDKLDGKTMKKFIGIRAKTYSYLIGDGSEDKKVKGTKENLSLKIIKNF